MNYLYRNSALSLWMAVLLLSLLSCNSPGKEAEDLVFFYFESCPSCDEYIMAQDFSEKIGKLNKDKKWDGKSYNLITSEAADQLRQTLQKKGLPDISRSLPLLIIGNEYINGYEAIGEKIDELSSPDS